MDRAAHDPALSCAAEERHMLKLPKQLAPHPKAEALTARFDETARPVRDGSPVLVSHWALDDALARALKAALGTGHLVQGLEAIAQQLDREKKGLDAVREKTGDAPAGRLSRLLLLASDGSERFYREAEAVLARHGDRLWGCRVEADAARLGEAFTPKGRPTKALLIDDKQALTLALLALA
jgi:hypothetical protein